MVSKSKIDKKDTLIKILGWAGVIAILALVFKAFSLVAATSFGDLAKTSDFITTFTGAFFAYVFVKLGELGTRLYDRQRRNQETLVSLEQHLNDLLNAISKRQFIANDIINSINETLSDSTGAIRINFNSLRPIPVNKELLLALLNIDLKNDIYAHYSEIESINISMETIQGFYDTMVNKSGCEST